jgi:hypothetical protein
VECVTGVIGAIVLIDSSIFLSYPPLACFPLLP